VDTFGKDLHPEDDEALHRAKVEKQVRRLTDDFEWLPNGDLKIVQHVRGERSTVMEALVGSLMSSREQVSPNRRTELVQWSVR